jgi:hypothetical protein
VLLDAATVLLVTARLPRLCDSSRRASLCRATPDDVLLVIVVVLLAAVRLSPPRCSSPS